MDRVMERWQRLAEDVNRDFPGPRWLKFYPAGGPNILGNFAKRYKHMRDLSDDENRRECYHYESIERQDPLYRMLWKIDAIYDTDRRLFPIAPEQPSVRGEHVDRIRGKIQRRELDEKSYTTLLDAAEQMLQKLNEKRGEEK